MKNLKLQMAELATQVVYAISSANPASRLEQLSASSGYSVSELERLAYPQFLPEPVRDGREGADPR